MKAKTIYQQTGWRRPGPQTICQDFDALVRVSEYDFDLNDPEFSRYCEQRGVGWKAGTGRRLAFTADHAATKERFLREFGSSEKGYVYSADEMETHWKIMRAAKGAMQDCWEVWCGW